VSSAAAGVESHNVPACLPSTACNVHCASDHRPERVVGEPAAAPLEPLTLEPHGEAPLDQRGRVHVARGLQRGSLECHLMNGRERRHLTNLTNLTRVCTHAGGVTCGGVTTHLLRELVCSHGGLGGAGTARGGQHGLRAEAATGVAKLEGRARHTARRRALAATRGMPDVLGTSACGSRRPCRAARMASRRAWLHTCP
jgi:hypothetical protein